MAIQAGEDPNVTAPSVLITLAAAHTREEVREHISEIGVVPAVRLPSAQESVFVAETLVATGIPVVEISVSVPGASGIIAQFAKRAPDVIVGAGNVLDMNVARRCLDQGARFLTSDGLLPELMELAAKQDAVVISGALTPNEILGAWNAGSDFVKVFPCDAVGGHSYIRSLKAAFPEISLIAAGGVNQLTATDLIAAGASAVGVGRDMFPDEAICLRQSSRIQELARRLLRGVHKGRSKNHRHN